MARKVPRGFSEKLAPILALELELGNTIAGVTRSGEDGAMTVRLARPLHRAEIGERLALGDAVVEEVPSPASPWEGFTCFDTQHALQAPPGTSLPSSDALLARLSPELARLHALELELGNEVEAVDEWSRDDPRVIVRYRGALHVEELVARIPAAGGITPFESWDPHYPLEEGLVCERTRHVLSGPPRFFERVRPALEAIASELVAGSYDALAERTAGEIGADALRACVELSEIVPATPPPAAYGCWGRGDGRAGVQARPGAKGTWHAFVYVWTRDQAKTYAGWADGVGMTGLSWVLAVHEEGRELAAVIEDLVLEREGLSALELEKKLRRKSARKKPPTSPRRPRRRNRPDR